MVCRRSLSSRFTPSSASRVFVASASTFSISRSLWVISFFALSTLVVPSLFDLSKYLTLALRALRKWTQDQHSKDERVCRVRVYILLSLLEWFVGFFERFEVNLGLIFDIL